jgi:hypothetical protein
LSERQEAAGLTEEETLERHKRDSGERRAGHAGGIRQKRYIERVRAFAAIKHSARERRRPDAEKIVAGAAEQLVDAAISIEGVITFEAVECIWAVGTNEIVTAGCAV